jgi:hypothetical protein
MTMMKGQVEWGYDWLWLLLLGRELLYDLTS